METEDFARVTKYTRRKEDEDYVTLVYPGGSAIMYGGTRVFDPKIHLNRWWQYNTRIEEGRKHFRCQLHSLPQNVIIQEIAVGDGFTLIRNSNTPHEDHRLYFPAGGCWPEKKIRTAGGLANLTGLLGHAIKMMRDEKQEFVRIICYVGPLMGMNQMDFHVHYLANPDNCDPNFPLEAALDLEQESLLRDFWLLNSQAVILDGPVRVVCDSIDRAGQSYFVSRRGVEADELAFAVNRTLELFAAGFTSIQGLAPDFQLMLEFWNGKFDWGFYSPYLHHKGVEQSTGFRKGVFVHPWGPEATLKRLREVEVS